MTAFFASGLAADIVLALIVLEAVALYGLGRRGIGPGLGADAPFLAAGAFLVLALRCALVGAPWYCTAAALAGSGVAHAVDLARRFRG
jgi:hypothetical protein